jgi:hypothetical protein
MAGDEEISVKSYFSFILIALTLGLSACAPKGGILPDTTSHEAAASPNGPSDNLATPPAITPQPTPAPNAQQPVLDKYAHLDPSHQVPTKLLADAVLYFDSNKASFQNQKVITVVDFSPHSSAKRMFLVDMSSGLVTSLYVAHGMGSDPNRTGFASKFSNISGSEMSSLGFFKTAETYNGSHGLMMRIDGLSSTNSNVRMRAIVVHGADYVTDAPVQQGRSWGCFAVPMVDHTTLIDTIRGGSLMYSGLSK